MIRSLLFALVSATLTVPAFGVQVTFDADFDRWNYPFNATPGFRGLAPTFAAFTGPTTFDEADGQFLVGFDTESAGIAPVAPAGFFYDIVSVKVSATHFSGAFNYDPTHDNYASYLSSGDPNFVPDADTGRPIELYGVGFRGGFNGADFTSGNPNPPIYEEGSFFSFAAPTVPKARNAFAFDVIAGDVSNPVQDGLFSTTPWATGQTDSLSPGDPVVQGVPGLSAGTTFDFEIDLSTPGVEQYILDGIADGGLFFSIMSLHTTSQTGGSNPNFYTGDNFDPAAIAPSITIEFDVVPVPEPTSIALMSIGMVGCIVVAVRRRRRR